MNPELITHWSEYAIAVQKTLLLATRGIRVFDPDLVRLNLETRENAFFLRRFLASSPRDGLQVVLRDAEPFRRNSPRLFQLFKDFPHLVEIRECAPQLQNLTDAMLLSDESHAVIRIHQDHARARTVIDNAGACRPYHMRFNDILAEGGTPVSVTTLGL